MCLEGACFQGDDLNLPLIFMNWISSDDTGQKSRQRETFHRQGTFIVSVHWVIRNWFAMVECRQHLCQLVNLEALYPNGKLTPRILSPKWSSCLIYTSMMLLQGSGPIFPSQIHHRDATHIALPYYPLLQFSPLRMRILQRCTTTLHHPTRIRAHLGLLLMAVVERRWW